MLSRAEQVALLPGFQAYLDDDDARQAAEQQDSYKDKVARDHGVEEVLLQEPSLPKKRNTLRSWRGKSTKKRRGPKVKPMGEKRRWGKWQAVVKILGLIVLHAITTEEVAQLLSHVIWRLVAVFPGLAEALAERGIQTSCKCSALSQAFRNFCEHPFFAKHSDCRIAVAEATIKSGLRNRRTAVKHGILLSRRNWKEGFADRRGTLAKRGRGSIQLNPEMQDLVKEVAEKNSHASSKFMMRKLPGAEAPEPVVVRHWTTVPFQIYQRCEALQNAMSFDTFARMLRKLVPHIKIGETLTDYCDHCHTFKTIVVKQPAACLVFFLGGGLTACQVSKKVFVYILPTFFFVANLRKLHNSIQKIRQCLEKIYPPYFQHFNEEFSPHQIRGASNLCRAYLSYLNTHTKTYRQELTAAKIRSLVFNLHSVEAKGEAELKWLEKVCKAYEFHQETAERQSQECKRQYDSLREGELLLWLDWKANWTLPLSNVATNDMYWAQARREVSCLGAVAFIGRPHAEPERAGFVFISDIIDHTCLACCEQMNLLKKELGPLSKFKNVFLWYDCGPHYRTVDLLAYLHEEWTAPHLHLVVNFHCEKHGKGQVDSLFGHCRTWVKRATMQKDCCIKDSKELVAILRAGASEDMKRFPVSAGGMRYEIRFWESERKPPTLYKADTDLQIRKTYCVQAHFVGGPQTRAVRWYNRFFSDLPPKNDATFGLSVKRVAIPSAERDWRRGYYANPRWMRSFPEQGQRDSLIERHQALQDYEQDLGSLSATTPSMLERKLARYQRHLASRKRMQQNKRRTLVSTAAADSSTSSSSDSTSNSD